MKNALIVSVASLALLTGCVTDQQDAKAIGQIGGAIAGGLLGNQFGSGAGRVLATAIGVGVGAWLGGEIAAALSERDQADLKSQSQTVLASVPDNQPIVWTAPESGKAVKITPSRTREEVKPVEIKRITRVAAPPAGFKLASQTLEATASARLRATPNTADPNIIGSFKKGDIIQTSGQVADGSWYMVSRDGVALGYIAASVVKPVTGASATVATAPELEGGIDLDKVESSQVQAATTCRTITYNLDEGKPQSVDTCKAADGAWQLG